MCAAGGGYLSTPGLGRSLPQYPTRASNLVGTERLPGGLQRLG